MPMSKKRLRNKVKQERRVGPKAKRKVRDARRVQDIVKLRDSKRKGNAAVRGDDDDGPAEGQLLDEVSSVDALFASLAEDGEEEDADGARSEGSESSAGEFQDVAADDDDEVRGQEAAQHLDDLDELDDEDDGDASARHVQDLKAIREKDPEFYKFLMAEDRALLDFEAQADAQPEGEEAGVEAHAPGGARTVSLELLARLKEYSPKVFRSFKTMLSVYHAAVQSIEAKEEEEEGGAQEAKDEQKEDDEEEEEGESKKRRRRKMFHIPDERVFSEVVEWSLANLAGLFHNYAGELQGSQGRGKKRRKAGIKGKAGTQPQAGKGLVDPRDYSRWSRVKIMAQIFWDDTLQLLRRMTAQPMLEFLLRSCSTPEVLSWLWPFKKVRALFFKRCCSLWTSAPSESVRLLAFLFLRNAGAMSLQHPDRASGEAPQFDQQLRMAMRAFADVAGRGYSWKSLGLFRFLENCFVELLRLHDATAYRMGYVCIRQLTVVFRNACIAAPKANAGSSAKSKISAKAKAKAKAAKGAGDSEKSKKRRAVQVKQAESLVAWPFVRAIYLWTRAVSELPVLRPLAYPLSMLVMGVVKSRIARLQDFPFVFHCLHSMNRLGADVEAFVPISAHLLKALASVLQAAEKSHRSNKAAGHQPVQAARAPELEVILHLSDAQVSETLTLETIGSTLCQLLIDHLGLLSRSPAFPEIVAPVLLHLRRHCKHCRSEALRRQLKGIVANAETSADDLQARRDALTEAPPCKKFLFFEADSAIAKARAAMLQRQAAEERKRIEAETRKEPKSSKKDKDKEVEEEESEERRDKKNKKRKLQEDKEKTSKKKIPADVVALAKRVVAAAKKPNADTVEEMGFSSGSED